MNSADLLVSGGIVVTMDTERRVLQDGAVAIRGDAVVAVGERPDIAKQYTAVRTVSAAGSLVMPGLVNGHAHAAMSLFRGIADDYPLDEWLGKYIFPAEARNVDEDFVAWGVRLGILEMLRGGITTYADMYYFEDRVARVTKDAGMRGVLGETVVDFPAPDHKTAQAALEYTRAFIANWKNDPLITPAVAPHSTYTVSEENLQASAELARATGVPLLTHVAEAPFETKRIKAKYGVTPVRYLEQAGLLGPNLVCAHCVWVDAADMALLAQFQVGCIHNPSSNMKLGSGVMPVVDLLAAGVRLGIGTDGAASNNNQDLLADMRLAAKLQKLTRMNPHAFPAQQVVEMATIGGAHALHMEKQIGSLEVGKKADLIVIDLGGAHATPIYNVYSQLVYALHAHDVKTVVVAGKILMEDRRMLTLDEAEVLAKAHEYQRKIAASLDGPGAM